MVRRRTKEERRSRWAWSEWRRTLRHRWTNAMPKFFRIIFWVCSLISGTALAANTAIVAGGGTTHEWWNDIYPYLLGIPAGMAFVAKFTQTYGKDGKPIDYDEYRKQQKSGKTILDHDNF